MISSPISYTNCTMHPWTWTEYNGNSYLQCHLLKEWRHGFFSQQWWPQTPSDLVEAIAPNTQAYRVKQVHGNTVLTVTEWQQQGIDASHRADASPLQEVPLPEADGVIAEQATDAVWAASADCVPVLIADESTGRAAAVHAGWRGTSKKIVPVAIQRLLDQGSRIEHLRVALGPAIAGEVYQVSTTVAAQVGATVVADIAPHHKMEGDSSNVDQKLQDDAIAHILDALKTLDHSPILEDPQPGRVRLDVRRVNALQLEHIGVSPEQVAIAPYCTYQDPDRFFSYRRTRHKKVQWSGIAAR